MADICRRMVARCCCGRWTRALESQTISAVLWIIGTEDLIEHSMEELLAQRLYGLALGYEDLNDHDELMRDPLLASLGKTDVEGHTRRRTADKGKAFVVEHVKPAGFSARTMRACTAATKRLSTTARR